MKLKWATLAISGILLMLFLLMLLLRPGIFIHALVEEPFIPLGNLLFWLAFIAFPIFLDAASFSFRQPAAAWDKWIAKGFRIAVVLAVLWWPVSYGLSGNFANTFSPGPSFVGSERAAGIFWAYSYAMVLLPVALWLLRMLLALLGKPRK
ncbi:hypothetical protein OZ410_10660 [Robiginitalea sp. M366]|uniref:hypothetical protein n=1 Tax=Robiginitalea aestuariiviva TaxID=3036903 RepID=UPI00240DFA15|nr:hypothetical protein [Robiginitalea aestuariiviva]MDG1572777.1 hypothetical protein [Robiginitalea aestuariiviva]